MSITIGKLPLVRELPAASVAVTVKVFAISQRGVRSERPLAVAVRRDGANHLTVVEDRHDVTRRSAAARGWRGIVGGVAFLQRAKVWF